jgi:hypothetical protein
MTVDFLPGYEGFTMKLCVKGGPGDGLLFLEVGDGDSTDEPVLTGSGMAADVSHFSYVLYPPEEHLTVTKTVDTSYQRAHDWTLEKAVDKTKILLYAPEGGGSQTGTATWTVTVGYDGYTDSGHTVSGTVTVENDGGSAAEITSLVDTLTTGGDAAVIELDCGDDPDWTLEPGDKLECTYAEAVDGKVTGSNKAVATTASGGSYESASVPIPDWGDPGTETDEEVTVTDVSDLLGTQDKTFTAPTGGTLTYDHTFSWDDFGQADCGTHQFDNTATLTSADSDLEKTASASDTVKVQCLLFQGETAWAANAGAGTLRYTPKGNWATYVVADASGKTYNVYAGQTMYVGTATLSAVSGGSVTITIDLVDGWDYASGGGANLKVQGYGSAPSGNPAPGRFAHHVTCTTDPCTTPAIPANSYYGIHLDVGRWVPDPSFP